MSETEFFAIVNEGLDHEFQEVSTKGTHAYPNGSVYAGEWNGKGEKHGRGRLGLPDRTSYVGGFLRDASSGLGVVVFRDGARYEGEIVDGWFHGCGVFSRCDGMKYEGEFRGGRIWGWGLVTFRDSTHGFPRQEGFFQDCRLVRGKRCKEVVEKAQRAAVLSRTQAEMFTFGVKAMKNVEG